MIAVFSDLYAVFCEEDDGKFVLKAGGDGYDVASALYQKGKKSCFISAYSSMDELGTFLKEDISSFSYILDGLSSPVETGIKIEFRSGRTIYPKGVRAATSVSSLLLANVLAESSLGTIDLCYVTAESLSIAPLASSIIDIVTFMNPKPEIVLADFGHVYSEDVYTRSKNILMPYVSRTLEKTGPDDIADILILLEEHKG